MEFDSVLRGRFSCRSFDEARKVSFKVISQVLDAARLAPSAGNLQSWRFIIVTDEKKISKIASSSLKQLWINASPVLIVVCSDSKNTKRHFGMRGEFYSIQDCAAATTIILLKAAELGLGACWVGAFDEETVRSILNIEEGIRPQSIVALGYTNEKAQEKERYPLDLVCSYNNFGDRRDDSFFPLDKQVNRAKGSSKRGLRRFFRRKK